MTGMIAGGWEFVWSAYGATVVTLIVYTASVLARFRRERARTVERPHPHE